MRWKTLLCAALLVAANAKADAPADYSGQALLQTEGEATWYRLAVPMSVYWAAAHADLRDLRVFNAADEALPYTLTATEEQRTEIRREVPARLFPLYGAKNDTDSRNDLSMRVRRDASGVLIEILSDHTQKTETGAPLRGWLLDASALDFPLERLRLQWEKGAEGFQRFRVEASDDLEHWQPWGEGQIARLDFDGERIERNEIRLPGGKARYLRLTWQTPEIAPPLNAATLVGVQSGYKSAPLLWSEPLTGQRSEADKNANANEFIWKLPLPLPRERLHVTVSEPNTLAPVIVSGAWRTAESARVDTRLGSKHCAHTQAPRDIWQTLASGLIYRLPVQGGEDAQEEIDLSGIPVNQLRLQIDSRGGGLPQKAGQAPQIRVAISGHQLTFLARGEPPYRLAFGRADAQSAALPLNTLVPTYDSRQPEKAQFGNAHLADAPAPVTLAANAPVSPEETAAQGKIYALWAALLAGVALLVGMAVSLLRGEKKADAG